jgi:hypothetical protein
MRLHQSGQRPISLIKRLHQSSQEPVSLINYIQQALELEVKELLEGLSTFDLHMYQVDVQVRDVSLGMLM